MQDTYPSFEKLLESETENVDFRIRCDARNSTVSIVAPHGGGIEPGTSEIAEVIAGNDLSYYIFEGIKSSNNSDLHITSTIFRERRCDQITASCSVVITIHGEGGDSETVFVGGKDDPAA